MYIRLASLVLMLSGSAMAQTIGVPTEVALPGGAATLSLDFANRDYELILYAGQTDATDTTRTYTYSITFGAASKRVAAFDSAAETSDRDRLESHLRHKEHMLAQRLKAKGGWVPLAPKAVQQQVGSTRSFVFEAFGGVRADQTVTAKLVASNTRALAYLDNALPTSADNISAVDIQAVLDEFSASTYPLLTNTFGSPSDVDRDGKVIFLFTHLVDQVGGVAGFYSSGSLFSTDEGGDGNEADMMFISPTRERTSYESLLAHEFQHLINFNQHVLVQKGDAEASWLNEGLSHVTEDMVGGHVYGGNTGLVADFLNAPERYALTGEAQLNSGVRGVAYLFVRGLMEEFGANIPGQLVQTSRAGIPNVEQVSGRSFDAVYQTFVSRLFLSGNGLNARSALNYTFEFFTEPQTDKRSLPTPLEHRINAQNPSVTGAVKPAAVSFVRIAGTGLQTVQIQTDLAGDFRALAIPLPKGFQPALALPVNIFEKITLDAPLPGVFTAGESVRFAGSTSDPTITQILLSLKPRSGQGEEIRYSLDVLGGQFGQSIVFTPSQSGEYTLAVFAGQQGELLPEVGTFPGVIVNATEGVVNLPADFFSGIALDVPLPTEYQAGNGASLVGRVTDPGIEVLLLVFTNDAQGTEIRIQTDVVGGAFRKGFVFLPEQAGVHTLTLFGGAKEGTVPELGRFSPIVVTATGTERVKLPVDLFDRVVLDAELDRTFIAGQSRNISGTVSDPLITQLAVSFSPLTGGGDIDVFTDVNGGRFSFDNISFADGQTGQYTITFFGGQQGQSLSSIGSFSPVEVVGARPAIGLSATAFSWSKIQAGSSQSQALAITNSGSQTLSISDVVFEAPFSAAPSTLTIAPGATASIDITFAPASGGDFTGTLQILSNDPDRGTQLVSLSGSAQAAVNAVTPDFDGDGTVGFSDFLAFAAAFGSRQGTPAFDARFDLDGSGDVGFPDFLTFAAAFGKPAAG